MPGINIIQKYTRSQKSLKRPECLASSRDGRLFDVMKIAVSTVTFPRLFTLKRFVAWNASISADSALLGAYTGPKRLFVWFNFETYHLCYSRLNLNFSTKAGFISRYYVRVKCVYLSRSNLWSGWMISVNLCVHSRYMWHPVVITQAKKWGTAAVSHRCM
jgi:hypothetical protein